MLRNTVLALGLVLITPLSAAAAEQVTLVNGTHLAVLTVQAKPHGTAAWDADLLDANTLGIGKSRKVTLPAGISCDADFLATLDDGHKVLIPAANVCRNNAVAVTDSR